MYLWTLQLQYSESATRDNEDIAVKHMAAFSDRFFFKGVKGWSLTNHAMLAPLPYWAASWS